MKRSVFHIFVVGFALFSMLFGAGNVIFPPYLGLGCGSQWVHGFFYYYLADIGLALIALFAVQHSGGYYQMTRHLGHSPSEALICVIILCIGPMLGIPRTAASTFEMSILPLFPTFHPILFSILFFAVVALLCLRESAVVDIIGKILTPFLLIGLLILIIKGVIHPIGPVSDQILVDNVPLTGIDAGYQTMDVLAIVVFGILIAKNVQEKGYKTLKQQNTIVFGCGLVAGTALLVVYLGLSYLGTTASNLFDLSVDRTVLVTTIVHTLLGNVGTVIFAVVVALACLTTAVALVSAVADYFSDLTGNKLRYTTLVVLVCAFSSVVTTFGLNQIISIAAPILEMVYPPTLFLVFLSFLDKHIRRDWVYRLGALAAFCTSLLSVLWKFGVPCGFVNRLPLASHGFAWLLPTIVCAALGALIPNRDSAA